VWDRTNVIKFGDNKAVSKGGVGVALNIQGREESERRCGVKRMKVGGLRKERYTPRVE